VPNPSASRLLSKDKTIRRPLDQLWWIPEESQTPRHPTIIVPCFRLTLDEPRTTNLRTGPPDYKPVFVSPCEATVIHLGRRLLPGSSDLPGSRNGADRSSSPIWSCSAWGLPCQRALLPPRCALTAPFHPYPSIT